MAKGGYDVWCSSCGCIMKRRKGKYGEFWGCTGYPVCRVTLNLRDAELSATAETTNEPFSWRD